ncbi:MAG: TolC family protein [Bacteroidales bacterium]|nr:TolC family protein [Bacteroidales bacterium]
MRIYTIMALVLMMATSTIAQTIQLSLDSCISMAIHNNKELEKSSLNKEAATYARKEAFTHYLPRIEAMGTYMHNQKEISLLSDEQKDKLNGMSSTMAGVVGQTMGTMNDKTTAMLQGMAQQNPQLAQQLAPIFQQFGDMAGQMANGMVQNISGIGPELVDALRTDTRNVTAAAIMLTQPLYMGGKIVAYNKITKYAEQIAQAQSDVKVHDLVVQVETAYWQIVSLESKRELALSYKSLIDTLDYNVQQLIAEGLASKADGLSVKVKKNEADVTIIQIDNGLVLSKMLLCQLCGLDINSDIHPVDDALSAPVGNVDLSAGNVELAKTSRPELQALDLLQKINDQKVKVVRAEYLPKVALSANYMWTNPSCFNGFENKFGGMWNVGVMVNIPLVNWGESVYKVRSAKLQARMSELTLDETREKIELQTTQCMQKVIEAANREETAMRSLAEAEENLKYANLGLNEGVIPISNVIMAQTAWLSAKSTALSARVDRRLAEVNLKRAVGKR